MPEGRLINNKKETFTVTNTTIHGRPNAYLIYTLYDQDLNIVPESSGALRVENPEELRDLAALEIRPSKSGYLHVYIANTSARAVNWDELAITRLRGQVLEINHYYPYGLQLFGIDNEGRSYPYKYGSKELQQDEWARRMVISNGFVNLDWLDFEARMYDPTVARWYNPDPAEQFMNPYLAMGNSPTMYVDPDGEFVFIIPHVSFGNGSFDIGLTVGIGFPGAASVQVTIGNTFQKYSSNSYVTVGGTIGGVTASVGYGSQTGYTAGVGFGLGFGPSGLSTNLNSIGYSWSQNYGSSINAYGTSITSSGFGFDPTIGYSTSYIPGRKGKVVPALYACNDCDAKVNLAEFEVIGQRDPYFGPFKHNGAGNYQAIRPPSSTKNVGNPSIGNALVLTSSQIIFNEVAVPIMLSEPTIFGEVVVGAVNAGFVIYNLIELVEAHPISFNYEKVDPIGLERFSRPGKRGVLVDPKTGQYLEPDRGRNTGSRGHGGSWWKLYTKDGKKIGTITKDGRWLRK